MNLSEVRNNEEEYYAFKQEVADASFRAIEGSEDKEALTASGEQGGEFIIPVLIPEGVPSGDGRTFEKGAISVKDLPMPLLWQESTDKGHSGSVIAGRIDSIEPLEEGGWGNARGYFDTGKYGQEAERLVRNRFLQGISADMDNFEGSIEEDEEDTEREEAAVSDSDSPKDLKEKAKKTKEIIKNDKIVVNKSRLIAATLVAKPAFSEAYITMADNDQPKEELEEIPDGEYEEAQDDVEGVSASLVASAIPVAPPREWFDNPELASATPITVDDEGRVFGHIATWSTSHIGLPGKTRPPRSRSDYAYFRTGVVRTDDGSDVPVGQLTLAGGHAPLSAGAADAVKHYDDTASAIADVTVGEDKSGIWVAGALRPEARPEQIRALRASAPSGDWRPINGRLELVAVCQVNVPGFPVARAMVSSGDISALVAAGARPLAEMRLAQEEALTDLSLRVNELELQLNKEAKDKATKRLASFASSVGYVPLAEQRENAMSRLTTFAQELSVATQKEKDNDPLVAAAEKAKKRIQRHNKK